MVLIFVLRSAESKAKNNPTLLKVLERGSGAGEGENFFQEVLSLPCNIKTITTI